MGVNGSTSLHQTHDDFEKSFCRQLAEFDFLTDDMTYHSKMSLEIKNRLSRIYGPTSLYTRTRSDRIAVHKSYPIAFQFEPKTHDNPKYKDWTIEAYPLAIHKVLAMTFGVYCLYIFYNPFTKEEAAFWSHNIPDLNCIMIPDREVNDIDWYTKFCRNVFQSTHIQHIGRVNGSGDPFVIIDEGIVKDLPTGIDLVKVALNRFKRLT